MQGIFSKLSTPSSAETPAGTSSSPITTTTAPATKAGLTTTPASSKAPPKSAPTTEAPTKAEGAAKPVVAAEQMGVRKPIEQKPSEDNKPEKPSAQGSPSTEDPSTETQPGKAAALLMPKADPWPGVGSPLLAKAGGAASGSSTTASSSKAPRFAPTSAAAIIAPGVKTISAMERGAATGSVLARGAGAKAEAPKAAAKPKSSTASTLPKATSASKAPMVSPFVPSSNPLGVVAPASVLKIVTGKPDPALATQADAMPTGTMGPARALTQSAAPALKALQTEGLTGGPPAVAVGRALAAGRPVTPAAQPGSKPTVPIGRKFQIVFVTGEVAPYSKTGGLGEAMDGLPTALAALGHRVMVLSPRYDQYEDAWDTGFWSSVNMGGKQEAVHFFHAYKQKVDEVFVDHPAFLERVDGKTGAKLYGPEWGKDFADNQARFAYFCKCALIAIKDLPLGGFPYGFNTVVVANDWHSALVPMFIHHEKASLPGSWGSTKTFFLCHNAVFQGRFEREDGLDKVFGVPASYVDSITFKMPLRVGKYKKKTMLVNTMAAGLQYVDRVLTVSPSYAAECAADPEKGVELEELFALGKVTGILNGVKEGVSPHNKNFVTKTKMCCGTFDASTVDAAKEELKEAYRKESGLPESEGPLMCFIGRLDAQKGYDLLLEALVDVLEDTEMQVVIVGAGRDDLVATTRAVEKKFPKKFYYAGWMGPERYALLGACDYTLLPSRWEPCGLVQMEAMRLGTLPIVAPTGGLKDTIEDGVNGIWMDCEMTVEAELDEESSASIERALRRAAEIHTSTPVMESTMKKAAMAAAAEFTWSNAAMQYELIFEELGAVDVLGGAAGSVTLEVDKEVC